MKVKLNKTNKNMKKIIFDGLIKEVVSSITDELKQYPYKNQDVLDLVLAAYNDYQEDERDGVDYLFDITNKDDVTCCIKGGMEVNEVAKLYADSLTNTTKYFFFGVNHKVAEPIADYSELVSQLIGSLDEVVANVIAYPYSYPSYKELYIRYITNTIISAL